jgi:hypothetical protein
VRKGRFRSGKRPFCANLVKIRLDHSLKYMTVRHPACNRLQINDIVNISLNPNPSSQRRKGAIFHISGVAGLKLVCSPVPFSSSPGKQLRWTAVVEVLWTPLPPARFSPATIHLYFI